jgi:hypothetical protein
MLARAIFQPLSYFSKVITLEKEAKNPWRSPENIKTTRTGTNTKQPLPQPLPQPAKQPMRSKALS